MLETQNKPAVLSRGLVYTIAPPGTDHAPCKKDLQAVSLERFEDCCAESVARF